MDIASPRKIANAAHHLDGHVAHALEGAVAQGHGWCHGDAVARMDAHRIKVLNRTHDGDIVIGVPKKLELEFFPTQEGLVDHDLVDGTQMKSACQLLLKGIFVVHHSCTSSAQRVGRPDAQWVPKLLGDFFPLQETLGRGLRRHGDVNLPHKLTECLAVLRDFNGLGVDPNHAHSMFFPNPHLLALDGEVQSRLPPHGGQHRINVMLLEDFDNRLWLQGLQVHVVGHHRIGHDGRRIAVDERDFDALLPKASGSLASRIVEFTGLSNDNRSASNDEDRFDAVVFGHFFFIRAPFFFSE